MINKKKFSIHTAILLACIILAMLCCSVLSLISYRTQLSKTLTDKIKSDLETYTNHSILLFQNIIYDSFAQMETVAMFCNTNTITNDNEIVAMLKRNNSANDYKRIGVSDLNGILYIGDGTPINISGQSYFQHAIKGEYVISDVVRNRSEGRDVVVLAMPLLSDGEIVGTVCAQYDIQVFTDLLGDSQFKGFGATLVMQKSGEMVSSYPGMEDFETFYDAMGQMEFYEPDTLASLRQRIEKDESGFFTYYRNGEPRYIYFQPTGINDYVMISLVLAKSMDDQLHDIEVQSLKLTAKNVIFYLVILICGWALSIFVRQIIEDNQKDQLTQVYNKISAQMAIEHFLKHQGKNGFHACLFIDIDNFKHINDDFGHDAGDSLLKDLTKKLRDSFRKTDIISRFGGDEFLVWMKNVPDFDIIEKKVKQLCKDLYHVSGMPVSLSIGVACYPGAGRNYDEILQNADKALYFAKKSGKNRYQFYTPGVDE